MLRKLNILALALVMVVLSYEYAMPYMSVALYGEEYKSLMYECDNAMRDHFIAKKTMEAQPNQLHVANLDAAELSLLVCHDYDKLRKQLMSYNVTENGLGNLGISALEERDYELERFVKTHEIRY